MAKRVFEVEDGVTIAFGGVVTKKVKATLEGGEVIEVPRKFEAARIYRFELKDDADSTVSAFYLESNGDGTFSEVGKNYAAPAFDDATEAKRLPK